MKLLDRIKSELEASKARTKAKRKAALVFRSGNFTLKPETRTMIARLKNIDWYSHVGSPAGHDGVRQVNSWDEAIALDANREWENTTLEASNEIGTSIQAVSWDEYQRWNEVVGFLKLELEPVWRQIKAAAQRQTTTRQQYKEIFNSTRWDIVHWGIELEFSEFNPPGLFGQLGEWYIHGHFPCGWEGEYPNGRLIVF